MSTQPNILITIADDQRFDQINCLGDKQVQTPCLDRFVSEGCAFVNAHHLGSMHGAVCAPSRAMLHTGRCLYHLPDSITCARNVNPRPDEGIPTLGELLRNAGYQTFVTGKWHNGRATLHRSFEDGDTIFIGGMSDHHKVPCHHFDPTGEYPESARYIGDGFSTDIFADAALGFLERYDAQKPFFLYCAYTAPHDPRTPLPEYRAMYPPENVELPPNYMPQHPFDNGELLIRDEKLNAWPRTEADIRRHIAEYYGMETHMDHAIGRIHDSLKGKGLWENTIVIHTADHGLAVGQHGLLGKQNVYEHSARVPLIMSGPGMPKGRRIEQFCYQHDLFPSLLAKAGVDIPSECEFKDLAPLTQGDDAEIYETMFCHYRGLHRMIKGERYKLIENAVAGTRRTQLFDYVDDPWETNDLSGDASMSVKIAELRVHLAEWQRRIDDPQADRFRA